MDTQTIPAYLDPSLPVEKRLRDLIGRMTLEEKVSQMVNKCPAIPRLGLPAYDYWSECLHGVAGNGRATVFPQAIGLAASWDSGLIYRVASAISDEGRAKYHAAVKRQGYTTQYQGLTFWSPNINIYRDPRWGRGQETYGEDPYLTGELAEAYVRGLQGDDPKYLKTAACAKHFAAHSGPEKDRHAFDARVSQRELNETYLPAFKRLVEEAGVEAVMGAYNRVNGEPACASQYLLSDILRKKWQFKGHVVSDCGSLTDIHAHHHFAADAVEAAALALKAGCDINCGNTYDNLREAIERGLISEADIDRSLRRTLLTRFKLGMFDSPVMVPYTSIPQSVICCRRHGRLAREAAVKSIVLLKNKDNCLPIRPDLRRIAVVGPNAASIEAMLGNYNGVNESITTMVEGIAGRAPQGVRISYHMGVLLHQAGINPLDATYHAAAASDITIACMGYSPLMESEEGDALLSVDQGDRPDIGLPPAQVAFVKKLAAGGARVVLVLFGGGPIALGELQELVEAVIFVWYPGQAGGQALADILFGDVSPSGKLPVTFPESTEQLPPFDDYRMEGRTYRFSRLEPLYPFGFGLSYTRFAYQDFRLNPDGQPGEKGLSFAVTLKNTGAMDGEEVVQVYLSDQEAAAYEPLHRLVGFRRVKVKTGKSKKVSFTLPREAFLTFDESGDFRLVRGPVRLTVGGCSPGPRGVALGAPTPLTELINVNE